MWISLGQEYRLTSLLLLPVTDSKLERIPFPSFPSTKYTRQVFQELPRWQWGQTDWIPQEDLSLFSLDNCLFSDFLLLTFCQWFLKNGGGEVPELLGGAFPNHLCLVSSLYLMFHQLPLAPKPLAVKWEPLLQWAKVAAGSGIHPSNT